MKLQHRLNRRSTLVASTVSSLAVFLGSTASADTKSPMKQLTLEQLKEVVAKLVGGPVEAIQASPVPDWYEVIVRGEVLYVDGAGKHLFQGHLVDIASRTSLTAQRKAAYEKASMPTMDVSKLDLGDAIKTVYGREFPGRFLIAFEDPRCGFCKRLHRTLITFEDLVVYTFPLSFLGPESRRFNELIWCSDDRTKAWRAVMEDIAPTQVVPTCDFKALDRNSALAERFRVQGTPTLFNAKGSRIDGAVGAAVLIQALNDGGQP